MFEIFDKTLDAMKRDNDRRNAPLVSGALLDACPERFIGMDEASCLEHAQGWLTYVEPFEIFLLKNVVALYLLRNQWGRFDDHDSEWIIEILDGPLTEDEKIGSLQELLY